MHACTVLVIDDEPQIRRVVRNALAAADRVKPAAEGLGPPTAAGQHRAAWESSFSTLLAALGLDDRFR